MSEWFLSYPTFSNVRQRVVSDASTCVGDKRQRKAQLSVALCQSRWFWAAPLVLNVKCLQSHRTNSFLCILYPARFVSLSRFSSETHALIHWYTDTCCLSVLIFAVFHTDKNLGAACMWYCISSEDDLSTANFQ